MPVLLTELQRIRTSGARAVEVFSVSGRELLAIPQLARDVPGTHAGMNGGDSDTDVLLFERVDGEWTPFGELPAPGGEDAEFFTIGDDAFLAVASIRTGSGPYEFALDSTIFRWSGDQFVPFQRVPTYAAKQWRHWRIGDRDFLGLAQGVVRPGNEDENLESVVYEWNGASFVEHQRIPSRWAYNWHPFTVGDQFFVAHADHVDPSVLYRWNGEKLEPHQTLATESGRAFASFSDGSGDYLVVACIGAPSRVLNWDGERFVDTQILDGLGARELAVVRVGGRIVVVRINFILGTPADPLPQLDSQLYEWTGTDLRVIATFPTCGATDVAVLDGGGRLELVVANSLSPTLRFAADTVRYAVELRGNATAPFESPALVELFTTYTAGPTSIAAHLADTATARAAGDPLIVATGTDLALYPGGGAPPSIEPFRLSTRGFKELAAISHLGPALATLARLREAGAPWEADAARLLAACKAARTANNVALWREHIAVRAFAGRERAIAAMVDYSCLLTERRLARALDDHDSFTVDALRADYLEGPADELPVPFNRIMTATFFLTGLDTSHRFLTWFDGLDLAWERAMVIVAGQSGRPTAGVTEESNSVAGMIRAAGRGRLPHDRLFIAPHAPVFPAFDGGSTEAAASLEPQYRRLWATLYATSELGGRMFADRPRFVPRTDGRVRIDANTRSVHEKPAIDSPDDWFALTTRLRVVMEDPRQLLSGAVTDYAARQLVDNHNDPSAVTVPGLDGEPFPLLNEEPFRE